MKRQAAVLSALTACATSLAVRYAGAQVEPVHLKDIVYKLEANYDDEMTGQFTRLADELGKRQVPRSLEEYFRRLARMGSGGTGFLVVDNSTKYIITNAHVVEGAKTVTIRRDRPDLPGGHETLGTGSLLLVDPALDLAVIAPPQSPLIPGRGFDVRVVPLDGAATVYAAGFPGLMGEQIWYFSRGEVNNPHVARASLSRLSLMEDYFIAHNAKIVPGNSGGPLLVPRVDVPPQAVRDSDASLFELAGVNTFGVGSNHYFSIPAPYVQAVIERARQAQRMTGNATVRSTALKQQAAVFRAELSKVRQTKEDQLLANFGLARFMSQTYVSRHGLVAFLEMLPNMNEEDRSQWLSNLEEKTVETLRVFAAINLAAQLSSVGDLTTAAFRTIDEANLEKIVRPGGEVTTVFGIGGRKQDFAWVLEHGQWRISSLNIQKQPGQDPAAPRVTRQTQAPASGGVEAILQEFRNFNPAEPESPAKQTPAGGRSVSLLVGAGAGSLSSSGSLLDGVEKQDLSGKAFRLLCDVPLGGGGIGLMFGASYLQKGTSVEGLTDEQRQITVTEVLDYVQLPALLRLDASVELGGQAVLRPSARLGAAADIVVSKKGSFKEGVLSVPASNNYFDKHNVVNVSMIYGFGVEVALGKIAVGADLQWDRHLLDEWTGDKWDGANEKYGSRYLGAFLKVGF